MEALVTWREIRGIMAQLRRLSHFSHWFRSKKTREVAAGFLTSLGWGNREDLAPRSKDDEASVNGATRANEAARCQRYNKLNFYSLLFNCKKSCQNSNVFVDSE